MHPPSARAKWISPLPATTNRTLVPSARPSPDAHEGGPRPTRNSYDSVTDPSPGARPAAVRAAHSLTPGGGGHPPRFDLSLSSACRSSEPLARSESAKATVAEPAANVASAITSAAFRNRLIVLTPLVDARSE